MQVTKVNYNDSGIKSYSYDANGRLIGLDNLLDSNSIRSYSYNYNLDGMLSNKQSVIDSNTTDERYQYTKLNQLSNYRCHGDSCPLDVKDKKLTDIYYSYGGLNNLKEVDTNNENITYNYNTKYPTRVDSISYCGKGYFASCHKDEMSYDGNGNMVSLKKVTSGDSLDNYTFSYDGAQNLVKLTKNQDEVNYTYDESNNLVEEKVQRANGAKDTIKNTYVGGSLFRVSDGDSSNYYISDGKINKGDYARGLTDGYNQTGYVKNGQVVGNYVYTPYGDSHNLDKQDNLNILSHSIGYRMVEEDPISKMQPLGNGYRFYDPEMRLFTKHDSESPYGAGGINGYSYASNNPINFSDPSGHASEADVQDNQNAWAKYDEKNERSCYNFWGNTSSNFSSIAIYFSRRC